jgi:hypothetical protein
MANHAHRTLVRKAKPLTLTDVMRANEQAMRVWQAKRIEARDKRRREFGLLK